jgi:hypothetical protein
MFIVSFDTIPYFGGVGSAHAEYCTVPPIYATSQIVLHESGVIDIYIQDRDVCSAWNSGNAIEGIQDSSGTHAAALPGRSIGAWTAHNDAWRFSPSCSGPIIVINNIVNADCGINNGSISTSTTHGFPPYTYLWNSMPPQTGANLIMFPLVIIV